MRSEENTVLMVIPYSGHWMCLTEFELILLSGGP